MKSFDIPGSYTFFKTGNENKEDNKGEPNNSNFKVSWFEEQVDTSITQRIISNYKFYNFKRTGPNSNNESCKEGGCCEHEPEKANKIMILTSNENKKDFFANFLEKLLSLSLDKLTGSPGSPRSIDLCPCEVVKNNGMHDPKDEVCHEKRSKACYNNNTNNHEDGNAVPLTALEMFIKNAMNDSLAKFKEEINKAIDHKFESLRTISQSVTSSNFGDVDAKSLKAEIKCPTLSEKVQGEREKNCSACAFKSEANECKFFGLIQPEIRNVIFEHEIPNFQSESINVIEQQSNELNLRKQRNENLEIYKIPLLEKSENPLTEVVIETSIIDSKTEDGMISDISEDNESCLMEETILDNNITNRFEDYDASENCIAEAIKKSANPKLMTDMTKFMYIIFESFRRLKEENLKKELENGSISSKTSSSFCELKEECLLVKETKKLEQTRGGSSCPNSSELVNLHKPKESLHLDATAEPSILQIDAMHWTNNNNNTDCSEHGKDLTIQSCDVEIKVENSEIIKSECDVQLRLNSQAITQTLTDPGYSVQKFIKKNSMGCKPSASSKILENLKELYLQNLNNIEQKMLSSYDCDDKYKCQIKKKFSPGISCVGTRMDSKFYCNLRSKTTDKGKKGEITMRINSRIRRKGSSNIISVRHSLIKSKNRSSFKNINKRREISLDSTVISLLDINLKNTSSWLRKLSSLSSEISREEGKTDEKGNLLKRLCFISFTWGKRHRNIARMIDQHLSNIYNAICLDFVTDDVYKSVIYISEHLRTGNQKSKDEIMRRWVKICNKPLYRDKKSFNLDCLHQIWVQFRTKICHLAKPPPIIPPNFFPALTYPSEENRLIKEQVIQKYARDILEYISDPKLYKHSVSIYSHSSLQQLL